MTVTMPRVAPGQIITSASYNALAAEIEALHLRIDQFTPAVTPTPASDDVGIRTVIQAPRNISGQVIVVLGRNFSTTESQNKVTVDGLSFPLLSGGTSESLSFIIPWKPITQSRTVKLRVQNLDTNTSAEIDITVEL